MNNAKCRILKEASKNIHKSQRDFSNSLGYSIGKINKYIQELESEGFLTNTFTLTNKAKNLIKANQPKGAVILAAGYGMRMAPINREISKGMLEVYGEKLIERLIIQLKEVGIEDIKIVVGFMKESYEYLIDKYGVELVVNAEYSTSNNLHSLAKAIDNLANIYIVPCDVWCRFNPFNELEINSWYMVSNQYGYKSTVKVNSKEELVRCKSKLKCNRMIGISYVNNDDCQILKRNIKAMASQSEYDNAFWETALFAGDKMLTSGRVVNSEDVFEIDTYEQLRGLDSNSSQLDNEAIKIISQHFGVSKEDILNIRSLKKGMTNNSFAFSCKGKEYIMRIPGKGTENLINRQQEADVYNAIDGIDTLDSAEYINPKNGYKIAEYYGNTRVCDQANMEDIKACFDIIKDLHRRKLKVNHSFDIFENIEFYESLWSEPSSYSDYEQTKQNVFKLKSFIDSFEKEWTLTHIDANPDNFLFINKDDGSRQIKLIDWEYAAMQDPHVDIAMFCIYAGYDREMTDKVIDLYFDGNCDVRTRMKIYAYISAAGLLWSNWCDYKHQLGIDFGAYSLKQYRYAKDYFKIVNEWRENA